MKGIYLCARSARHLNYNLDYNDIDPKFNCNLTCDCKTVDLSKYDFIIATPPCNYWSIANYRREKSKVALETKHLLKYCLESCIKANVPFIVENVRNAPLFRKNDLMNYPLNIYDIGRHTYRTNVELNLNNIPDQELEFVAKKSYGNRDNTKNVYNVIEEFLRVIHKEEE